jgi:sigma-B regulation protein RsbU (phosphoserine phosphatase)
LMPDPPQIVGLDIAISFVPCRWVGGDYVDVLTTPDGRTLLLLADVSGKGIQAALTCSSIHAMVHAAVPSDIPLPQLVSTLNDHLCRYLPQTSFVTMVCLLLDPSSGNYECVNAGHPPILVAGVDGQITELQHSANLPLGLQAMELTNQTGTIEPGRLLAMYSDGLTEAMNAQNRQWGMAGLSAQLGALYKASPGKPLADLVAQLEQAVDAWQEGRLATDDRTFLLAGRR